MIEKASQYFESILVSNQSRLKCRLHLTRNRLLQVSSMLPSYSFFSYTFINDRQIIHHFFNDRVNYKTELFVDISLTVQLTN